MKRRIVQLIARSLFVAATIVGGAGCSDSSDEQGSEESFESALRSYDATLEQVSTSFVKTVDATYRLDAALRADSTADVDEALGDLALGTSALLSATVAWERLEQSIQGTPLAEEGRITQPLVFIIGIGITIYGTYKFGKQMKEMSDELTEQRKRRDDAQTRVGNGESGAEEDLSRAKADMNATGAKAITTVTTKVTTDLVTSAIPGSSLGGLILKEATGKAVEKGITVITATEECADELSTGCRLSVQKTDANGRVTVPEGTHSVVVSTPNKARVAVSKVKVKAGQDTTITRDLVPVDQATRESVLANDKGENNPPPASITVTGTYPAAPFNGMQIDYQVTGPASATATDVEDFTTSRTYSGELGSSVFRVQGTARMGNGYYADLTVTVDVDGTTDSDSARIESGFPDFNEYQFDVSVPIPADASTGSFSINMVGSYNAGTRGLIVSGTFD